MNDRRLARAVLRGLIVGCLCLILTSGTYVLVAAVWLHRSPAGTLLVGFGAGLLIVAAAVASGMRCYRAVAVAPPSNLRQCCRCGYDLTGNVSGICPECGERI